MEDVKISIIVPIYNTEKFLSKCLDSIVGQTYQNLEIILVNDGSTDSCGDICDEYAACDNRIQVIHKLNGGVSSARNAGLAVATGEWLGWVDSDDWIEPDMYAYLLTHAKDSDADIAVCSRFERYYNRCVFRGWEREEVLNTTQAMELLLKNDIMQNYLCDKIWRHDLFNGVSFPEGHTFEDIAVMHRLFAAAERIVCLPRAMYNYFQRAGSIVDDQSLENRLNHYRAAKLRLEEMRSQWPQFLTLLEAQCVASSIMIWCSYYKNPKEERKKAYPQLVEIAKFAKQHCEDALQYMHLGITGRAVLHLTKYPTWWSFKLAGFFSWLYSLKHGRAL